MHHYRNGWFFGRKSNGDVRVLKLEDKAHAIWPTADGEHPDAEVDLTIDGRCWCSIIASVSQHGETGATFDAAKAYHGV